MIRKYDILVQHSPTSVSYYYYWLSICQIRLQDEPAGLPTATRSFEPWTTVTSVHDVGPAGVEVSKDIWTALLWTSPHTWISR